MKSLKWEINCQIKTQMYDGTDDLEEYVTQLNLFSELNNWIADSKALVLTSRLSGVLEHF